MYRVEIFSDNEWVISSWHRREDMARINADVISKSRTCHARVIFDGLIIYEVGNG